MRPNLHILWLVWLACLTFPAKSDTVLKYLLADTLIQNGSSQAEKMQNQTFSGMSTFQQCEDSDASQNIIKETVASAYGNNLGNFNNVIKFITEIFCPKMKYIGLTTLYDAMESNGHEHTNEMMTLIYWIKMASSDASSDAKVLSNYDKLKAKIPSSMRSILFGEYVRLLNVDKNEYMYEANIWVDGHRLILTWVPGGASSQDTFYFEAHMDNSSQLYYIIRNDFFNHGEPMCQSNSYYSPERRKTVTCPNEVINNRMRWFLQPVAGTTFFKISNWDGTLLYSPADDLQYDKDRRYVFTWQRTDWTGSSPGYWVVI